MDRRASFASPQVQGRGRAADQSDDWIDRSEEIDGTTYIREYYLKKYGSAKKGLNP